MSEDDVPILLFPRYIEKKWKNRTIAFFRENMIVTEAMQELPCQDYDTFVHLVFQRNLLTFVESLVIFPWLEQLVEYGTVHSTKKGQPTSGYLRGIKNTTRWIVSASAWNYGSVGPNMLRELRMVYTYCGVGVHGTPGGLGQATIRKSFKDAYGPEWKFHRHQRPPEIACQELMKKGTGARSDLIKPGEQPEAWLIDQKNGYIANCHDLATGRCFRLLGGCDIGDYVVFFCRCQVVISQPLVLGCFPVRIEQADGTTSPSYPTSVGTYEAYLWTWEYHEALRLGCSVTVMDGWGWKEVTNDLDTWKKFMSQLRDSAPPDIVDHIKHIIVAALGRFNMDTGKYFLVPGEQAQEGDTPVAYKKLAYDWFVHYEQDYNPLTMPHWYQQIISLCRFALYQEALPYARSEHLLATNTDAIIVSSSADVTHYKDKAEKRETGEYSKTKLTEVNIPHLRHVLSNEYTVQPGKKKGTT